MNGWRLNDVCGWFHPDGDGYTVVLSDGAIAAGDAMRRANEDDFECLEWGAMHIVCADQNVEDGNIRFCAALPEATDTDRAICAMLLPLNENERMTALAIMDGNLTREHNP